MSVLCCKWYCICFSEHWCHRASWSQPVFRKRAALWSHPQPFLFSCSNRFLPYWQIMLCMTYIIWFMVILIVYVIIWYSLVGRCKNESKYYNLAIFLIYDNCGEDQMKVILYLLWFSFLNNFDSWGSPELTDSAYE